MLNGTEVYQYNNQDGMEVKKPSLIVHGDTGHIQTSGKGKKVRNLEKWWSQLQAAGSRDKFIMPHVYGIPVSMPTKSAKKNGNISGLQYQLSNLDERMLTNQVTAQLWLSFQEECS